MTHLLQTAVDGIIARLVLMEPLAVAAVYTGTTATDQWLVTNATFPCWVNKSRGLRRVGDQKWVLSVTARLWLAHIAQATYGSSTSPQANSFLAEAAVLGYFEDHWGLDVTGQTAVSYLAAERITITSPRGLDYVNAVQPAMEGLFIDFEIDVPIQLSLYR
jgi:hypothetical protein